jgi:5-methyltetrahydrofolate--homocysteine methyltransferase
MHTTVSSADKTLTIGSDQPFCIIGERINPTGRKTFQEQLRAGDLSAVEKDVADQIAGGAMMLDVNMGAPLVDEAALLAEAVRLIQRLTDVPLCIDSSIVEALEAGLAAYEGKALVNSVTAEDERMEMILPLVKQYGAAVIALPNDDKEIPEDPQRRFELTEYIVEKATGTYGIPIEDIVIDPLAHRGGLTDGGANPRDDSPDRRPNRRQYDPGCLERVLRNARPTHPQFGLPSDGHGCRINQRDHGCAHSIDRDGSESG